MDCQVNYYTYYMGAHDLRALFSFLVYVVLLCT
jgi:hypothetical protein